jgi:hypothetical protein
VDHEIAFSLVALVKILLRVDLEDKIAHLESDWLHLLRDGLTRLLDMTESLVRLAVDVRKSCCPLGLDLVKNIWWNTQL